MVFLISIIPNLVTEGEDIELATTLAKSINEISKDLIYLVPTGSKMEKAAK